MTRYIIVKYKNYEDCKSSIKFFKNQDIEYYFVSEKFDIVIPEDQYMFIKLFVPNIGRSKPMTLKSLVTSKGNLLDKNFKKICIDHNSLYHMPANQL